MRTETYMEQIKQFIRRKTVCVWGGVGEEGEGVKWSMKIARKYDDLKVTFAWVAIKFRLATKSSNKG